MTEPLNHEKYIKALCKIAGHLFQVGVHVPQPSERRDALVAMRAAIDEALRDPQAEEKPPEMPRARVVYQVQTTCDGEHWVHHPHEFESETLAARWAAEDFTRWQRICRTETSYALVPRTDRRD